MNDTHKHAANPTLDDLARRFNGTPSADIDEAAELVAQADGMLGQIAANITLTRESLTKMKGEATAKLNRLNTLRGQGKPDEVRQLIEELSELTMKLNELGGAPSAPVPAAPSAPGTKSWSLSRRRTTGAQPEPTATPDIPVTEQPAAPVEPPAPSPAEEPAAPKPRSGLRQAFDSMFPPMEKSKG